MRHLTVQRIEGPAHRNLPECDGQSNAICPISTGALAEMPEAAEISLRVRFGGIATGSRPVANPAISAVSPKKAEVIQSNSSSATRDCGFRRHCNLKTIEAECKKIEWRAHRATSNAIATNSSFSRSSCLPHSRQRFAGTIIQDPSKHVLLGMAAGRSQLPRHNVNRRSNWTPSNKRLENTMHRSLTTSWR